MQPRSLIATGIVILFAVSLSGQANTGSANPACVPEGESVYQPGVDGVKPPQPQPVKDEKTGTDVRAPFSLELIVNSEGRVCDTRVLKAKDPVSADKVAQYILANWKFKPATRKGKPVAVKFIMNWSGR